MGSFSIWHWLVVGGIALLLFGGRGKISEMMGDVAKGIKAFKKGIAEDDTAQKPAQSVTDQSAATTTSEPAPSAQPHSPRA